jgi:hypothetical protein
VLTVEGGVQVKVEEGVNLHALRVPHSSLLAMLGCVCVYGATGCTADSSRVDTGGSALRCCSTVGDAASTDGEEPSPLHVGEVSHGSTRRLGLGAGTKLLTPP